METYRDFIIHAGVKGMKWGVWNEETAKRYKGLGIKAQASTPTEAPKSFAGSSGGGSDEDEDDLEDILNEILKTAQDSQGDFGEFIDSLREKAYNKYLKDKVEETKDKAQNFIDKYLYLRDAYLYMNESERKQLREQAKKNRKK